MKHLTILGAGGMGTALAWLLAKSGRAVTLWGRDPARVGQLIATRENALHLPGVRLPDSVRPTPDAAEAAQGAELIVVAIPSAFLRATLTALADRLPSGVPVLSVVKGIESTPTEPPGQSGTEPQSPPAALRPRPSGFARPSQIVVAALGPRPVAILSGPSHAEEIARGLPASVVVAGEDEGLCLEVQGLLNQGMFRVYTNRDALGVELAGALKNILGIAAGICDGLGFGDNAKAALLTRGLVEIARFAVALGAEASTFYGLAGVGDVITTCYSPFGRNRALGERIGRGATLTEALAASPNVAEGVPTTRSVHELACQRGIDMPITREVHQILFEGKAPLDAVANLMVRLPKVEWNL
jgi:glycerol-3-phosphate dehydrogenase (NAD(P)+)